MWLGVSCINVSRAIVVEGVIRPKKLSCMPWTGWQDRQYLLNIKKFSALICCNALYALIFGMCIWHKNLKNIQEGLQPFFNYIFSFDLKNLYFSHIGNKVGTPRHITTKKVNIKDIANGYSSKCLIMIRYYILCNRPLFFLLLSNIYICRDIDKSN